MDRLCVSVWDFVCLFTFQLCVYVICLLVEQTTLWTQTWSFSRLSSHTRHRPLACWLMTATVCHIDRFENEQKTQPLRLTEDICFSSFSVHFVLFSFSRTSTHMTMMMSIGSAQHDMRQRFVWQEETFENSTFVFTTKCYGPNVTQQWMENCFQNSFYFSVSFDFDFLYKKIYLRFVCLI